MYNVMLTVPEPIIFMKGMIAHHVKALLFVYFKQDVILSI